MGWENRPAYSADFGRNSLTLFHRARLYWNTLRYLKASQIYGRVVFWLRSPKVDLRTAPKLNEHGAWVLPASRRSSMLTPTKFSFLNQEGELLSKEDWCSESVPKLWLYNLHYFDDLNGEGFQSREAWHSPLIRRWIEENPPGHGVGWEPYPTSLRIVNWIKWVLRGNVMSQAALNSLASQVRFLVNRLETHLLGNHLFVNAKALVFAGCFFQGDEADEWFKRGVSILTKEIPEQILADGGQFERSTMYHALAYEDMLDIYNLLQAYPHRWGQWCMPISVMQDLLDRMGRWLLVMCHPDGEISFFNDAAMGVAPKPQALFSYAARLGLNLPSIVETVTWLKDSGYIRVEYDEAVLLIDVALLGPDYLPAHGHADTLSYELSVRGQRVIVNGGTSRYGVGDEREQERGTAAHSTMELNGENSSEVWGGFRVARRARPFDVSIEGVGENVVICASHDGYKRLPGQPIHKRQWLVGNGCVEITDWVEGVFISATSRVQFHPDIKLELNGSSGYILWSSDRAIFDVVGGIASVGKTQWHPGFGVAIDNCCLQMGLVANDGMSGLTLKVNW